jgi:hypothetical protein
LSPGRCEAANSCKCWLVVGTCDAPIGHESYSIYKLGAPTDTTSRFTYNYRVPVESITSVVGGGSSIQYCDFNQVPNVPLFKKTFQGQEWTLVRRVQPGPSWHSATDELLGTDEYGTYCGQYGAAESCDTSMATFSIPFGDHGRSSMVWDQIMFSSGDMEMWMILDKGEMDSCTGGTNDGQWHPQVASANGHTDPYSVTQYCRQGAEEDPWLSVEEHPSQVLYGEGSFNVPAWCDSRGQLAPDLSANPEVSTIGTINGVTFYKVPMGTKKMSNKAIQKACGRLKLLTPCYQVGDAATDWNTGNCQAVPGQSDNNYLPESIAAQVFGCQGGPGNCPQMDGMFTVIYNHMDDRPCAIIDGGYCHESEPQYQSSVERPLYGICSFAVGVGSCPAPCYQGTAGDGQCPNTCEHCNDDAIMGHGGANVWIHEVVGDTPDDYTCVEQDLSWEQAQSNCAGMGLTLATIHNDANQRAALEKCPGGGWIGLRDDDPVRRIPEGEFIFTDGTVIGTTDPQSGAWVRANGAYHNWADGEPNDAAAGGASNEDCTQMKGGSSSTHCEGGTGTGCWNDRRCDDTRSSICGPTDRIAPPPGGGHRLLDGTEQKNTTAVAWPSIALFQGRKLQSGFGSLGGFSLPVAAACPMEQVQSRLDEVNGICCTADVPCADGLPAACGIKCAIVYSKFYDECYHVLMTIVQASENPGAADVFDDFQTQCRSAFDPRSLLDVISSAQCCGGTQTGLNSEVMGHACDANDAGAGATWSQIDDKMTSYKSAVDYCTSQGASLCPRSRYCVQGDLAMGEPAIWTTRTAERMKARLVCKSLRNGSQ